MLRNDLLHNRRCTGYKPLIDATMAAAAVMRGEMTKEDLVFKQTGDSIVGTNYIRPSAAQKVTGTSVSSLSRISILSTPLIFNVFLIMSHSSF